MAAVFETTATLRSFGADLDPEAVTAALGARPTRGVKAGDLLSTRRGVERAAKDGMWLLEAARRSPGDLDRQIEELFATLTTDLAVWRDLTARFQADLFLGLFLGSSNEGIREPRTLVEVSMRGFTVDFDVYDSSPEN